MKTILFSAVAIALFLGLYAATLRRSNLFRLRRYYLIGTLLVAMIIPFVSIETKAPQVARVNAYVHHIPMFEEVSVPQIETQEVATEPVQAVTTNEPVAVPIAGTAPVPWTWEDALLTVYLIGCAVSFILLLLKLMKTASYYRRARLSEDLSTWEMRVRVLAEPDGNIPFSFLRSVFVNPEVFTDSELQQVLAHERAHIRQRHTVDLLFLEAVKVLQWFNPIIYLYLREMKSVHEYLADEEVLAQGTVKRDYLELLYKQLCVGKFVPVGNSFRHFITKKRIQMMNQKEKRRMSAWWLLVLIPLMGGMLLVNCHPKTDILSEEVAIDEPVCENPDVMPEFPGGIQQYVDNLYSSMQYPELAKKYKMQGIFTVRFIVEKDGRIRHLELDTAYAKWKSEEGCLVAMLGKNGYTLAHFDPGECTSLDEESRNEIIRQLYESFIAEFSRAFSAAPACKPAMKDGQPVRYQLWIPVAFTADENLPAKVTVTDPRSSRNSTSVEFVESDSQGPRFLRVQIDTFPCETCEVQWSSIDLCEKPKSR